MAGPLSVIWNISVLRLWEEVGQAEACLVRDMKYLHLMIWEEEVKQAEACLSKIHHTLSALVLFVTCLHCTGVFFTVLTLTVDLVAKYFAHQTVLYLSLVFPQYLFKTKYRYFQSPLHDLRLRFILVWLHFTGVPVACLACVQCQYIFVHSEHWENMWAKCTVSSVQWKWIFS